MKVRWPPRGERPITEHARVLPHTARVAGGEARDGAERREPVSLPHGAEATARTGAQHPHSSPLRPSEPQEHQAARGPHSHPAFGSMPAKAGRKPSVVCVEHLGLGFAEWRS